MQRKANRKKGSWMVEQLLFFRRKDMVRGTQQSAIRTVGDNIWAR